MRSSAGPSSPCSLAARSGIRPAAPLHYAAATIRIDEVLAGGLTVPDAAELTLEIPLFDGIDSIGSIEASVGSEGAFLLRNKGASARAAGLSAADQLEDAAY